MKEKPRLKDTDEILSSIGKRASVSGASLTGNDGVQTYSRHRQESAIDALLSAAPADLPPQEPQDAAPLDFSKYELPERRERPGMEPPDTPAAVQQAPATPAPAVQEYVFPTLEELEKRKAQAPTPNQQNNVPGEAESREEFLQKLSSRFEEQFAERFRGSASKMPDNIPEKTPSSIQAETPQPKQSAPEAGASSRSAPRNPWMEELHTASDSTGQQKPDTPPMPQPQQNFLWEELPLSGKELVPEAAQLPKPPAKNTQPVTKAKRFLLNALGLQEAENVEAEDFLTQFASEVKTEEAARTEDFKEALTEKFMRERENYLREFAERAREEAATPPLRPSSPAVPPASGRKKLDYAIRPEMHVQKGETLPPRPMTYDRTATARPQTLPKNTQNLYAQKSGEELLLELAQTQKRKLQQARVAGSPGAKAAGRPKRQDARDIAAQQFRFSPHSPKRLSGKEPPRQGRNNTLPIILLACAVTLFSMGTFVLYHDLNSPRSSAQDATGVQETYAAAQQTFYENRSFPERARFNDVIIPRNISVQNMDVEDRLVIEDIGSPGSVRLDNVTVSGVLYVKSCAVEGLELHDVTAGRVVVNNTDAEVTLSISGTTDIQTLEMRTPVEIVQTDLAEDSPGLRNVLAKSPEDGSPIRARLSALELHTLSTEGEAVLELADATVVENMTASGSLSLAGDGRVASLSVEEDALQNPLTVQTDGVPVSLLHVKSPANLRLASQIDAISASHSLSLSGGGVGALNLNREFGSGRLLVDIADSNVHALTANTPARIYASGATNINTLTANDSVYLLGNKVNHLDVKAPNVIYEKEPDRITVESGITPPQTTADNPHLDYQLSNTAETGSEAAVSTGSSPFPAGNGSKDSPFEVSTPAQLAAVANYPSAHFVQTGHIDIAQDSAYADGFPMLASAGTPFSGVYDGGGYSISNLRIFSDKENVGLFAENTGTIRNVHIASGEVVSNSTQRAFVGGIAGLNYEGGTVSASANGAKITGGAGAYVGGVVGYNYGGKVRDCYNAAKITGTDCVGGVVGMNRQNGVLSSSYNVGTIEGTGNTGAVVGINEASVVTNCYYLADTASGGIGSGNGTATEVSAENMRGQQLVVDLSAGSDNSPWRQGTAGGYQYPVLQPSSTADAPAMAE